MSEINQGVLIDGYAYVSSETERLIGSIPVKTMVGKALLTNNAFSSEIEPDHIYARHEAVKELLENVEVRDRLRAQIDEYAEYEAYARGFYVMPKVSARQYANLTKAYQALRSVSDGELLTDLKSSLSQELLSRVSFI